MGDVDMITDPVSIYSNEDLWGYHCWKEVVLDGNEGLYYPSHRYSLPVERTDLQALIQPQTHEKNKRKTK